MGLPTLGFGFLVQKRGGLVTGDWAVVKLGCALLLRRIHPTNNDCAPAEYPGKAGPEREPYLVKGAQLPAQPGPPGCRRGRATATLTPFSSCPAPLHAQSASTLCAFAGGLAPEPGEGRASGWGGGGSRTP